MFEVAYETTFCATHLLHRDGQPVEPPHGHDWRVEVVAAGEALDRLGVVVDFEHLKAAVGDVCRRFHYGDILGQGLPKADQDDAIRASMEKTLHTVVAAIARGKLP